MEKDLKLIAKSAEDIHLLSVFLQDALVPIHQATFDQKNNHFSMIATRFHWEKQTPSQGQRSLSALSFENIEKVETKGMKLAGKSSKNLSLLSLTHDQNHIVLTFSGQKHIRLKTKNIKIKVRDHGTPWPAKTPEHALHQEKV